MPHFRIILSGRGIDLPIDDTSAIGFFTTRLVRATDLAAAEVHATELVSAEWRPGGKCATANQADVPVLMVEDSFPVSFWLGVFGRKATGYAFYNHED